MLEKIGLPSKPSLRGNTWVVDSSHCQGCSSQFTFINRKVFSPFSIIFSNIFTWFSCSLNTHVLDLWNLGFFGQRLSMVSLKFLFLKFFCGLFLFYLFSIKDWSFVLEWSVLVWLFWFLEFLIFLYMDGLFLFFLFLIKDLSFLPVWFVLV